MLHSSMSSRARQASSSENLSDPQRLYDLINSAWITQAIYVAAELRLADAMRDGTSDIMTLAQVTACVPDTLHRLLRALCAVGICESHGDDQFLLTPMGMLLCEEGPASLQGWARLWGQRLWRQWGTLLESVRTGDGWRKRMAQQDGYEQLNADPDAAALFYEAMRSITRIVTTEAAHHIDLSTTKRVVDVGGGHGEFLATVMSVWPGSHGICLDLAAAEAGATQLLSRAGVEDRAKFEIGNFFEKIPSGDLLLLKSVLHNWSDGECRQILSACRQALKDQGRLLIVERMLAPVVSNCDLDRSIVQADLNMLSGVSGRERTLKQFKQMLADAGFKTAKIIELPLGFSLIECVLPVG